MVITGLGLRFLIKPSYTCFGDWSTFSLFYSLRNILPDCEVAIRPQRAIDISRQLFVWTHRCNIKRLLQEPYIELDSSQVLLRVVSGNLDCSEAKEDKSTPFISFRDGCGKFVTSDWINKNDYPFPLAEHFITKDMCSNEIEVVKLWKRLNQPYSFLSGG